MSLQLRPYQAALVARARDALKAHRSTVIQLPTGGGKTAVASVMLQGVVERRRPGYFFVHRQELIDQTAETFDKAGLPYGVVSAGYRANPYQPLQICSIATVAARLAAGMAMPVPALCLWDECHHFGAPSWRAVMGYFRAALHVGLSATPQRLDGVGLHDCFASLVCGPSVAELIAQGYLADYRAFAPSAPDLRRLHVRAGEFVTKETAHVMDRPTITGDAIQHYMRLANGGRALVFCVSVEHSNHVCQQFRDAGIEAVHLDGKSDRGTRRHAVADFRRGDIKVLTNVDLFGEGFDVPDAEVAIALRPTKSLTLAAQQWGRVMRPKSDGRPAILLDHAGNLQRHGLPDEPRQWSLLGKLKRASAGDEDLELKQAQCPACACRHVVQPRCPACGYQYAARGAGARVIEEVEGDLEEVAGGLRARRAASVDELIAVGRERGYKNPEQWARSYWLAKEQGAP